MRRNDQPRVTAPDRYVGPATVSDPSINLQSTRADDDHAEKQSLFEVPLRDSSNGQVVINYKHDVFARFLHTQLIRSYIFHVFDRH